MIKMKYMYGYKIRVGGVLTYNNILVVGNKVKLRFFGGESSVISSNRIAKKLLKKGNTTAKDINKILASAGISISQSQLQQMLATPRLEFNDLSSDTLKSEKYLDNIGSYSSNIQTPGVYIWTHLPTGHKYVGSSSKLARRLQGYFRGTHRPVGIFIPFLKLEGIDKFKLEIIPIKTLYLPNMELALEQYFLLQPEFTLNKLKAVNGYSGSRGKTVFMYNMDYTKLIYQSEIKEDFVFKLGIHRKTLDKGLKGELYLGKYRFSDNPVVEAIDINLSENEVYNILELDRAQDKKVLGRKVICTSIDNKNNVKFFDSINDSIIFFNSIDKSNKTSLLRHIEADKPYHGYLCRLEGDKKLLFLDKSLVVKITDLSTNTVKFYPSIRKAALFCKTTGQTISAYNGKVFMDVYKIEIINKSNSLDLTVIETKESGFSWWLLIIFPFLFLLYLLHYLFMDDSYENFSYDIPETEVKNITKTEVDFIPKTEMNVVKVDNIKENNLLDYNPNDESDYFPDNSAYYKKIEEDLIKEKQSYETITNNLEANYKNSKVCLNAGLVDENLSTPQTGFTSIVGQIREGENVMYTPSSTTKTPDTITPNYIQPNLNTPSIPPTPDNTPITPTTRIIETKRVEEGEDIPPLPKFSDLQQGDPDYHIKRKIYDARFERDLDKNYPTYGDPTYSDSSTDSTSNNKLLENTNKEKLDGTLIDLDGRVERVTNSFENKITDEDVIPERNIDRGSENSTGPKDKNR